MTDKDTPAFPVSEEALMRNLIGMTLRDYFMAHAPAEPQPWFEPMLPPKPSLAPFVSIDGQRFYSEENAAQKAEGSYYRSENQEAILQWNAESVKQRYVQWPAAWADEMLKARGA